MKSLVFGLHKQCVDLKIKFEIICVEDSSTNTFNNQTLKEIKYITYKYLTKNIGRSKIRNLLARSAKNNFLLFIDADSEIKNNDNFIQNYITESLSLTSENELIYGQTLYKQDKPIRKKILHWTYGKKIESKNKKNNFSSHHFLCKKSLFNKCQFDENIDSYGYEDVLFGKEKKIKYINNPLFHIGLKNSNKFIYDTESSLKNIIKFSANSKIFTIWKLTYKLYIDRLISIIFKLTKRLILRNLHSENPSMLLFQFYKLGYICYVKDDQTKNKRAI